MEEEELRSLIAEASALRGAQEAMIAKLQPYRRFLHEAVDKTHEVRTAAPRCARAREAGWAHHLCTWQFGSVADMINRHGTLSTVHSESLEAEAVQTDRLNEMRSKRMVSNSHHKNAQMDGEVAIARLKAQLATAEEQLLVHTAAADKVMQAASGNTLLNGRIKMSISNMYSLVRGQGSASKGSARKVRGRKGSGQEPQASSENQVEQVGVFLRDLMDIMSELDQQQAMLLAAA